MRLHESKRWLHESSMKAVSYQKVIEEEEAPEMVDD